MKPILLVITLAFGHAWLLQAAPVRLELPTETATLKPGPNMALAAANCLTCHSAEYISTQPKLPQAFWKASVEKMKAKYGAPIPDDQMVPLIDYLAAAYGAPAK
jgi:cytochrome c553